MKDNCKYGNLIFFYFSSKNIDNTSYSLIFVPKINFMKNISMTINVVLIIAVGVLYYLHFKSAETAISLQDQQIKNFVPLPGTGIVYVNSDSLLDQYEFYKNERSKFESAQKGIKNELQSQGEKLQGEVDLYQKQAIGMTDMERAQKEEQLTMKQQQLMQRKEELLSKLDDEQSKSSEELYSRLNQYLRKFNKNRNYNFVLGFQKGGGILFANDSLNITNDVVEGLNKEYLEEKK